MEVKVKHNGSSKFYVELDGEEATMQYEKAPENVIEFQHTFVPEKYRGKGIAEKIAETALSYARENNFKVLPTCKFVSTYIRRHKQYQDLL